MTFRQTILKFLYPFILKSSRKTIRGTILVNKENIKPVDSFYDLKATTNNNREVDFKEFRNKKVLIVNTASNCGYTAQFSELQRTHIDLGDKLTIIGFPANDFKEQETGSDGEIASFCQVNFGVTFPLAKKSRVVKGNGQHGVYEWLTMQSKNGWNDHQPDWNFSKYLIDENGVLTHYFGPSVSPLDKEMKDALL